MKRLLLLGLLWAALPAAADVGAFGEANQAYLRGEYGQAIEAYRSLVEEGVDDPDVWFNLGNAYFGLGDPARARAAWERALQLSPRDGSIRHNLEHVRALVTDPEPLPGPLLALSQRFTLDELAAVTSSLYFLGVAALLWHLRRPDPRARRAAILLLTLLALWGTLLAVRIADGSKGDPAVVVSDTVRLHNGPGTEFSEGPTLSAGSLVRVMRAEGSWREVAAMGRVKGWLRQEEVEEVGP